MGALGILGKGKKEGKRGREGDRAATAMQMGEKKEEEEEEEEGFSEREGGRGSEASAARKPPSGNEEQIGRRRRRWLLLLLLQTARTRQLAGSGDRVSWLGGEHVQVWTKASTKCFQTDPPPLFPVQS